MRIIILIIFLRGILGTADVPRQNETFDQIIIFPQFSIDGLFVK